MRRAVAGVALLAATGCVFPSYDLTGVELSWLFVESNVADGDTGQRVRTCVGAGAKSVNVTITDQDDSARSRTFPHDCSQGYQTVEEFQLAPSDVFISLSPGEYSVVTQAVTAAGVALARDEQEVSVSSRGIAVVALDLPLPVVEWKLDISGETACDDLSFRLVYAGAEDALADATGDTDGEASDILYRNNLTSNTDLSLGGVAIGCSDAGGLHTFENLDVGEYRLLVEVDGSTCPLALRIDRPDLTLALDLENLPCAG